MDPLEKNLEHYLSEVTWLKVKLDPVIFSDLPYFLSHQYAFYSLVIGKTSFTAVFLREEDKFKPAQFIKHMRQISSIDVAEICVVTQSLPTYVRKRLIEKGIAFVIPKVQMYLPALGMDLRARQGRSPTLSVERFSPATQVVLIYWLLGRIKGAMTPLELSKQLGYSNMTMSRTLDELEGSKIAQVERIGRERLVTFQRDCKTIWQEALPKLRNPVSRTIRIATKNLDKWDLLPAGLTALSNHSMLSETAYPEYSLSRDTWKIMEKTGVEEIPVEEPGTCLLQVWCYDPKILKVDGHVDPFSLFLSLKDENDERIEMALEEMIEQFL